MMLMAMTMCDKIRTVGIGLWLQEWSDVSIDMISLPYDKFILIDISKLHRTFYPVFH